MGFRSTFTTECYWYIEWPGWFVDKYKECVWFNTDNKGVIAAKKEAKTHMTWKHLPNDIQKAIDWVRLLEKKLIPKTIVLVYLHECGGITRCLISQDQIKWEEPNGWSETDGVEHCDCWRHV